VLLSTPLHASSNFTVSVQLANKRGFKQQQKIEEKSNNFSIFACVFVAVVNYPAVA
jgi:hypothetical protein